MILIVCLDDKNGMMFNKRRQSKDVAVREDIAAMVGLGTLWMNEYSAKQFAEETAADMNISVNESFLDKAGPGEYCFLEGPGASAAEQKIEKIIVYKWNRLYPADVRFDILLDNWKLDNASEFTGNSHEKITKEVYIK